MSDILAAIYDGAVSVTPSDSANLPGSKPWAGLYVGTTQPGSIAVTTSRGSQATFQNVRPGAFLRIAVQKVWATGTTCTGIVALGAMPYPGGSQ
jgi:hypothetical protein